MAPHKSRTSAVWYHFSDEGNDKAKCSYCKGLYSFSSGSIANLKRHLKNAHPSVSLSRTEPSPVQQTRRMIL